MLRRYLARARAVLRALSRDGRLERRRLKASVAEMLAPGRHRALPPEEQALVAATHQDVLDQRTGEWPEVGVLAFEEDPLAAPAVPAVGFDSPLFLDVIERQTMAGTLTETGAADLETTGAWHAFEVRQWLQAVTR